MLNSLSWALSSAHASVEIISAFCHVAQKSYLKGVETLFCTQCSISITCYLTLKKPSDLDS